MKASKFMGIAIIAFGFVSCKTSSDIHNSQNSLDWNGTYKNISAVSEGNEKISVLTLRNDQTYQAQTSVVNSKDNTSSEAGESSGTFSWNKKGNEVTLKDSGTSNKTVYQVGENQLTLISENGKKPSTAYVMNKIPKEEITEKYWKLIELNGKPVVVEDWMRREPYIILKKENNRIVGTSGCNSFNGTYELKQGNRITISKVAATMMACINMEIESGMFRVFEMADNYTLSEDGKTLSLNRARMAPLARFEVVYLR